MPAIRTTTIMLSIPSFASSCLCINRVHVFSHQLAFRQRLAQLEAGMKQTFAACLHRCLHRISAFNEQVLEGTCNLPAGRAPNLGQFESCRVAGNGCRHSTAPATRPSGGPLEGANKEVQLGGRSRLLDVTAPPLVARARTHGLLVGVLEGFEVVGRGGG